MQAVVHRWHERGRQGCGQPEHWLRRLHHHLRRWVVARDLSHWPKRQHDWHFSLCAWPRRQDLPGTHLRQLDRKGQYYGLLHQVQTPCSHKRRCPSGCHSIWDERPSGGLSRSRCASRTTCPPSAVSTGTAVRSSARSGRHRAQIGLIRCPRPVIKRRTVTRAAPRLRAHYLRRRRSLSITPPLGGTPGRTGPTMPVPDQERPALSCSPAS